jgi:L-serine dehydratase
MKEVFHSALEMFKIGVGPSSSHTLGPWKAALDFRLQLGKALPEGSIEVHLYGSLAKTGHGHGTDFAVKMGLLGEDPTTTPLELMQAKIQDLRIEKRIEVGSCFYAFEPDRDVVFHFDKALDYHPNGMTFCLFKDSSLLLERTYYSVGGGFIEKEFEDGEGEQKQVYTEEVPFPFQRAKDLEKALSATGKSIWELAWMNETSYRTELAVDNQLKEIWRVMLECIYGGCHKTGILPGGLQVKRRAAEINSKLLQGKIYQDLQEWQTLIKYSDFSHNRVIKWISCFALAVNEENAAFGRIVTAPTNGAAGVIPAVLMYHACFSLTFQPEHIKEFLLTAGQIGVLFKQNATISAAMGGCQAEIGVSSAMAAAGLTACLGGTPEQALMAAEIAMEHHLGMTCDPIGGLVQIPCIERNSMGAVKAITAAHLALESDPKDAKVTLDSVIDTMWQTALDMNTKYKETSEGGLALQIPISLSEC